MQLIFEAKHKKEKKKPSYQNRIGIKSERSEAIMSYYWKQILFK